MPEDAIEFLIRRRDACIDEVDHIVERLTQLEDDVAETLDLLAAARDEVRKFNQAIVSVRRNP